MYILCTNVYLQHKIIERKNVKQRSSLIIWLIFFLFPNQTKFLLFVCLSQLAKNNSQCYIIKKDFLDGSVTITWKTNSILSIFHSKLTKKLVTLGKSVSEQSFIFLKMSIDGTDFFVKLTETGWRLWLTFLLWGSG